MTDNEIVWTCPTCHKPLDDSELDVMMKSRVAVPVLKPAKPKKIVRKVKKPKPAPVVVPAPQPSLVAEPLPVVQPPAPVEEVVEEEEQYSALE